MRIAFIVVILLLKALFPVYAQDSCTFTKKQTLTLSGIVRTDAIFDTRQVVEAREGYLLLYPKKEELDKNGKDINAHGSFNQYAMTARLATKVNGPDLLNAKTMAYIEGDFTGASNSELNSFRLRHAYLKLKWDHASLLAGQYWHPLNIPEMIPNVLALNTGAPFHPYNRQPQLRFDYKSGKMNTMFAISTQRDYTNTGTAGASSIYLRNSMIPNLDGQIHFVDENLFAGIGIDYKRLMPRLVTDSNYKTNSGINCLSYTAFLKAKMKSVEIKMQLIYGQSLNDQSILGGYGVSSTETLTNEQKYSPLNYFSGWMTIQTTGKIWQYSLFAGFSKGFGTKDVITGLVYARDGNIAYLYRFSPMISYTNSKFVIAAECEYTTAAYGKMDEYCKVFDSSPVANARIILSLGYSF